MKQSLSFVPLCEGEHCRLVSKLDGSSEAETVDVPPIWQGLDQLVLVRLPDRMSTD